MRKLLVVVGLSLGAVACSSGPDTSTPVAACNSTASAYCNKLSSCSALGTGQSVTTCISATEIALSCSTQSCPSGTTYNSANAATCINNYSAQSCADAIAQVTPPGCSLSLICP